MLNEVETDALDDKVNDVFAGRVVRKDLLHQIKKGTNVPSFVLEYLLAKYCASDDPDEIEAGIQAVFETIDRNYVRPDESNKAQSMVQQKGRHKLIDKVHVRYVESEKRHWAEMENFNSRRISINEQYYKDTDRLLEGGIWAEVVLGHNDQEDDDYAFYIEYLRPIQLSLFNDDRYFGGFFAPLDLSLANSITAGSFTISLAYSHSSSRTTTLLSWDRAAQESRISSASLPHTQRSSVVDKPPRQHSFTTKSVRR